MDDDPRTSTIKRAALKAAVEKAIEKGMDQAEYYLTREQVKFQADCLREMVRTCEGVDYQCFNRRYGCPATQAGIRGWYCTWFTRWFDTIMCSLVEPEPNPISGWSARVED